MAQKLCREERGKAESENQGLFCTKGRKLGEDSTQGGQGKTQQRNHKETSRGVILT